MTRALPIAVAITAFSLLALPASSRAAVGRTAGAGGVSATGAFNYQIPIWVPPGPRGIQPNLALVYDSRAGNGTAGVGWSLGGLGSIQRCVKTLAQDGGTESQWAIAGFTSDGYCLNGNRLRRTSGTYGMSGSTYQTELADFSQITANGTSGSGPASFTVLSKDGLTYEYGNTANSRVSGPSSTVYQWWLNKVSDRSGNNYVVSYGIGQPGSQTIVVPLTISWTPSSSGSSTYNYTVGFTYTTRTGNDVVTGYQAGLLGTNTNRLQAITVSKESTVVRYYNLAYTIGGTTQRSRLQTFKECADTAMTDCLSPTTFTAVEGVTGVSGTSATALSSTSSSVRVHDFDGDGRSDLLYNSGGTLYVAISTGSGFGTPVSTSVSASGLYDVADLAGNGAASIVAGGTDGTWWRYTWSGTAFIGVSTGVAIDSGQYPYMNLIDANGDGLPDLVTFLGVPAGPAQHWNTQVYTRLNTSSGGTISFAGTRTTYTQLCNPSGGWLYACVPTWNWFPSPETQIDGNGDGREDTVVGFAQVGSFGQTTQARWLLLSNGTTYTSVSLNPSAAIPNSGGKRVHWNDDQCSDSLSSQTVFISNCHGGTAQSFGFSGTLLATTDWNGDGRTDLLVHSGIALRVYTSTGNGISSPITTSIPLGTSDTVIPLEVDGDGLMDVAILSGTSPYPVTFRLHNGIDSSPDLLSSVMDGYGLATSPTYIRIAKGNYTPGTGAQAPEQELDRTTLVVSQLSLPDGVGSTYTQSYWYTGGRRNAQGRGFEGFQMRQVTDSRNGQIRETSYDLLFPLTGMIKQDDLFHSDGTTLISHSVFTNTSHTLDASPNNQRYFAYVSSTTTETREVGGSKNGQMISLLEISRGTPDSYGNIGTTTETVTDKDTGSAFLNQSWLTTTTTDFLPDPGNWCVGQPEGMTVAKTAPGQSTITRTADYVVNYSACRRTSEVIEPGNPTYEVSRAFEFDVFGNVKTETVTGAAMPARAATIDWGTTGQFPEKLKDPVGYTAGYQVLKGYDYARGLQTSEVVQTSDGATNNTPATSWLHDSFGRVTKETRPDNTSKSWTYSDCTSSCFNGNHRLTVTLTALDTGGGPITDQITFLDRFERPLVTRQKLLDNTYNQTERQYDNFGRLYRQSVPCSAESCAVYWVTNTYDALNRPIEIARPISEANGTDQSTTIQYLGRSTVVTDAQGKTTTKVMDVAGNLRQSLDHSNYSQSFTYDSFGSVTSVFDSQSIQLFAATYEYGVGAFQRASTDNDLGGRTATYNALGEQVEYTDAKGQVFKMTYDALSRPLTRRDGVTGPTTQETKTTWEWGVSAAAHNIGKLKGVSVESASGAYAENFAFDDRGRTTNRAITVPTEGSHDYNFAYNATTGLLETLTYPISTASYRLSASYCYQNGHLLKVADNNCTGTVFWQANQMTVRGQIKKESLGNGIVTNRTFDAVTGWMSNSISGPIATPASVQNESYLFDLVGNVTQRQNNAVGLTESFFYDNLYRLEYSTLNNGSTTVTNLDPGYDASGNILTNTETGGTDAPIALTTTWTSYNYPSQITAGVQASNDQTVSFSYGPNRRRWRTIFTSGAITETTFHVGGLLEKVVSGGTTDYRHYIYAGGNLIAVYSRQSSGTNTLSYVLEDHQGSVASVLDNNGGVSVNENFTAFGNRRSANTWSGSPSGTELATMSSITRQGYTGHAALGTMGLNHMNGRVQDAISGRFLSPDPLVIAPDNTQSFARYSYVHNNPLTYVDPSGFSPDFPCTQNWVYIPPTGYGAEVNIPASGGGVTHYPGGGNFQVTVSCIPGMTPRPPTPTPPSPPPSGETLQGEADTECFAPFSFAGSSFATAYAERLANAIAVSLDSLTAGLDFGPQIKGSVSAFGIKPDFTFGAWNGNLSLSAAGNLTLSVKSPVPDELTYGEVSLSVGPMVVGAGRDSVTEGVSTRNGSFERTEEGFFGSLRLNTWKSNFLKFGVHVQFFFGAKVEFDLDRALTCMAAD